jgi:hypothetical protein
LLGLLHSAVVLVQLHHEVVDAGGKRRWQLIPAAEHFAEALQPEWAEGSVWDGSLGHAETVSLWLAR